MTVSHPTHTEVLVKYIWIQEKRNILAVDLIFLEELRNYSKFSKITSVCSLRIKIIFKIIFISNKTMCCYLQCKFSLESVMTPVIEVFRVSPKNYSLKFINFEAIRIFSKQVFCLWLNLTSWLEPSWMIISTH